MFLAVRYLRFAAGRFALIGGVVALLSVLVAFLTGLSSGLVDSGISGLRRLPITHLALAEGSKAVFSQSQLGPSALGRWRGRASFAEPIGVSFVTGVSPSGARVALALFGAASDSGLLPRARSGRAPGEGQVLVSAQTVSEGVHVGQTITLAGSGTVLRVAGVGDTGTYGHANVAFTPLPTWQRAMTGGRDVFSAVALRLASGVPVAAIDAAAQTTLYTKSGAYVGSPGYTAETATMSLIRGFLYVIVALVLGAFVVVWTLERARQIALLRALGASATYVLSSALLQIGVVVILATAFGTALGAAGGALIGGGVPFSLHPVQLTFAAGLVIVFGVAGVLVAARRMLRIDPLSALGIDR